MKTGLSEKEIEIISEQVSKFPDVLAVYLLGSAANDVMRQGSDIDLAILTFAGKKITGSELLTLSGNLGYSLGLDFDIGEMSSKNLVYSKEAILTGKCIFTKDKLKTEQKINTLLSMYYNFQIERREVLNAYRK